MGSSRLGKKILLIISSLVSGLIAGFLILLFNLVSRTVDTVTAETKVRTDQLLTKSIDMGRTRGEILANFIANQPGSKSVIQADFPTVSDYLDSLVEQSNVDWVMFFGPNGSVLGQSKLAPKTSPFGSFVKSLNDAHEVDLSSKLEWSGVKRHADIPSILAVQPIQLGQFTSGFVLVGIDFSKTFLSEIGNLAGVNLNLAEGSASTKEAGQIIWNPMVKISEDSDSVGLMAQMPLDRITRNFDLLKWSLVVLFFVALAVSVGLAYGLAHSITKPLDGILRSVHILQSGHWPEPQEEVRNDEIGTLQVAFDQMTCDLKNNYERLASMLSIDPLTELLNHRTFVERLESKVELVKQFRADFYLVLIDIDQFAQVNEERSPKGANEVLVKIANLLKSEVAEVMFAGRNGGDEFVFCTTANEVETVSDQLRLRIAELTGVTASIGIAELNDNIHDASLLMLAAELARDQAKVAGKNRVRFLKELQIDSTDTDASVLFTNNSYAAVRALAEAVDAKDEYTRGHSQRVAQFARDLAEYCGFDPGFVDLVYVTGTLHDVGKIGVPDAALKKPGRLTDEEFEMIKLHPALGEKIVSQIPQLADTLSGIRGHHERYDGRGYPDQLAGEEISLTARILAIADTYDAMTSDRPYRKGMEVGFALSEIRKGAGSQFDPELAEKFIEMFESRELKIAA